MAAADERRVSSALFGTKYRLEICAALADDSKSLTYARELSRQLGVPDPQVRSELLRLELGGFLERVPRVTDGGSEPQYYRRLPSPLWAFALELAAMARVSA